MLWGENRAVLRAEVKAVRQMWVGQDSEGERGCGQSCRFSIGAALRIVSGWRGLTWVSLGCSVRN